MSSRTALAWYKVMKTAFKTKNKKSDFFIIFTMKFLDFKSDLKKTYIQRNTAHNNKEFIKLGFSALVCIFVLCYKEFKSS